MLVIWGMPVAYLGAILTMLLTDTSINVVSTFALLLVTGIIVDDAVPLFHTHTLAPMLEVAAQLIAENSKEHAIVGYYFGNEHIDNKDPPILAERVILGVENMCSGAVLVQRSWRESGEDVDREIRAEDPNKIRLALEDGWVITFPRGTTDNSKPVRKGTAHIIKDNNPTVIPVKISGFNEVFQRNGLKVINRKLPFSIEISEPLSNDIYSRSIDDITLELEKIID